MALRLSRSSITLLQSIVLIKTTAVSIEELKNCFTQSILTKKYVKVEIGFASLRSYYDLNHYIEICVQIFCFYVWM